MAFAADAAANGTATGISLTVNASAKLVVATFAKRSVNDPTGVTFGGVAMTRLTERVNGTALGAEIWYLVNPPTGAQSLAFTLTGSVRVTVSSYTVGAGNTAAFDVENGGSGTSTGPSTAVTPTVQPNLIVTTCVHESSSAMTAKGAGQAGLMPTLGGTGFVDEGVWNTAATHEETTSVSSDTQSFTNGTSDTWAIASAVFKEVSGPQTVSPTGIGSAQSFGSPTLLPGNVNVTITGLGSAQAFGAPSVSSSGPQTVLVSGIASASNFGIPTMVPGSVTVSIVGIGSAQSFGAANVTTPGSEQPSVSLRSRIRFAHHRR